MDFDPEAAVPVQVVPGGKTYFKDFQRSLESRARCSNHLDFRGTRARKDLDNLLNIFAFVRDFRLSAMGGRGARLGDTFRRLSPNMSARHLSKVSCRLFPNMYPRHVR